VELRRGRLGLRPRPDEDLEALSGPQDLVLALGRAQHRLDLAPDGQVAAAGGVEEGPALGGRERRGTVEALDDASEALRLVLAEWLPGWLAQRFCRSRIHGRPRS
jgi:hypothetical protein